MRQVFSFFALFKQWACVGRDFSCFRASVFPFSVSYSLPKISCPDLCSKCVWRCGQTGRTFPLWLPNPNLFYSVDKQPGFTYIYVRLRWGNSVRSSSISHQLRVSKGSRYSDFNVSVIKIIYFLGKLATCHSTKEFEWLRRITIISHGFSQFWVRYEVNI